MTAHRHAQAERQREGKTRVIDTRSRIRRETRDAQAAAKIGIQAPRSLERHGAAKMKVLDLDARGGGRRPSQARGLSAVEQFVLHQVVGQDVEGDRQGAVIIDVHGLVSVSALKVASDPVARKRGYFVR